jgi:putative transposase
MDPMDMIAAGRSQRVFRATRKLNAPNLVSHITQRAAGREPLFLEESDYLTMIALIKDTAEEYSLAAFAFCLMPNHVHLLLSPREPNLYDAMRYLFSRYAMRFNKKYERKGHLVGGPYRQAVCLDDGYLLAASLYIHQNPVRAGVAKSPLAYRWSSCRLYCEDTGKESFVDPEFVLGLLSADGDSTRRRYSDLLNEGDGLETGNVLEQEDVIERYRARLASMLPSIFERIREKKRIAAHSGADFLDSRQLADLTVAVRMGRFPNKPESNQAKKYLIEQLVARGYKRQEIAQRLGMSRKTVYNLLKASM